MDTEKQSIEKVVGEEEINARNESETYQKNRERLIELEMEKAEKEQMIKRAEMWIRVDLGPAIQEREFWMLEARILDKQISALKSGQEMSRDEAIEILKKEYYDLLGYERNRLKYGDNDPDSISIPVWSNTPILLNENEWGSNGTGIIKIQFDAKNTEEFMQSILNGRKTTPEDWEKMKLVEI